MSENALHTAVADFLTLVIAPAGKARDGVLWTSYELRNAKNAAEGARRKRVGCAPGMPDVLIYADGYSYGIELKTADGRKSKAQDEMHKELVEAGVRVALCRSVEHVENALRHWGIDHRRVS